MFPKGVVPEPKGLRAEIVYESAPRRRRRLMKHVVRYLIHLGLNIVIVGCGIITVGPYTSVRMFLALLLVTVLGTFTGYIFRVLETMEIKHEEDSNDSGDNPYEYLISFRSVFLMDDIGRNTYDEILEQSKHWELKDED